MVPIYIITLAKATERKAHMTAQMARLGLTYTFFEGIDGEALTKEEIDKVYNKKLAQQSYYGELTYGEIGCALSHRKIWEQLANSAAPGYVILEDDALLKAQIVPILSRLANIASSGDVIILNPTPTPHLVYRQKRVTKTHRLVYVNQAFVGATGYYITQKAAQTFLLKFPKIYFPIDFWYQTPGFKGVVPIKSLSPPLVNVAPFTSTIGARGPLEKAQFHPPAGLFSFAYKYKRHFLYQFFRKTRLSLKHRYFSWPSKW